MNPRSFLNLFQTRTGKLVLFMMLSGAALMLVGAYRNGHAPSDSVQPIPSVIAASNDKPQVVQTIHKPMEPFHVPPPKLEPSPVPALPTNHAVAQAPPPQPPPSAPQPPAPIGLFAETPVPATKTLSPNYAPFGRLIPCETVITVDSASIQTPIIGLIIHDIYHGGRLIIPAGTEVHGTAQTDRSRERIYSGTSWTLVWQTGEEMRLRAIALDREFSGDQEGWGITDGSAGLRGRIIKTDNMADIKLFAATFLSGAASALTERQATLLGPIASPTLNNAPLQGAQAVLQAYAQRIYETIQRDGFYVRVSSGKQFYLYVLQTIDRADARIGGGETPFGESAPHDMPRIENPPTLKATQSTIPNP